MLTQDNEALRHEVEMYTSVSVPLEAKLRTTITRVGRPPHPITGATVEEPNHIVAREPQTKETVTALISKLLKVTVKNR